MIESLTSITRAGAAIILTYFAKPAAGCWGNTGILACVGLMLLVPVVFQETHTGKNACCYTGKNARVTGTFRHLATLPVCEGKRGAMTTDEALMLEFQRGSREAFDELFARYREPLFGFYRRRLAIPSERRI